MADKSWKANEREFARWAQDVWVADPDFGIRRNDSRVNADDSSRNSDVDIDHRKLAISKSARRNGKQLRYGVTVELTRQKSGLSTLYKWLDKAKSVAEPSCHTIVVINGKWLLFERDTLPWLYDLLQSAAQMRDPSLFYLASEVNIVNVTSKLELTIVKDKLEQSSRYGKTKGLFPLVVVREPKKRQVVIADLAEIHGLLSE